MTPEQRAWLREQIIVVMRRDPNTTLKQMKAYVREDPTVDWATVNNKTFHNYLDRNMAKYRDKGSLKRKPGTGGNGQISLTSPPLSQLLNVAKVAQAHHFRNF